MKTQNIAADTKMGKRLAKTQVRKLMGVIKELLGIAGYVNYEDDVLAMFAEIEEENKKIFTQPGNLDCEDVAFGLKVLEGKDKNYLLTWTTNAYEDREGEFFTLKSIQEYVENNAENENKGTYQFWHVENSDFADIVWQGVAGKFLVEIGVFKDNYIGKSFKMFFKEHPIAHPDFAPDGWGCSHGFVYRKADREDGVYEWFDKKETTILPLQEAANVFTLMEIF